MEQSRAADAPLRALPLTGRLARLAPLAQERPEIRTFVDFIHTSTRSLVR